MPLNFLIIIRATVRAGCMQKRSYAVNTCHGFPQSNDTRGGKGRGGGTGQQGLCSAAVHAERGQVRTNDDSWLAQCHSRHVACTSRYSPCVCHRCAHRRAGGGRVALAVHVEREEQIRENNESFM